MLKTVRRAFQIEDIRKRIFYTFVMLIVVRLGSQLPTPVTEGTVTAAVTEEGREPLTLDCREINIHVI